MSTFNVTRSILSGSKCISSIFNTHGCIEVRTVTVAAGAEKMKDPALANAKPFEEMPKLPMFPFVGSAWVYFPLIGRYHHQKFHEADLHKHKVYGNVVREKFGPINAVSCYDPQTVEVVFRHEGKYPSRGTFFTLKAYRESRRNWYKNAGILILQDKEWYDLRSTAQKHLMKPKAIQAYLEPMQDLAKDFISLMRHKRQTNQEVPDLLEDLYKWALESVAYVGLDTRLDCLNPNLPAHSDGRKMIDSVKTKFACMNKLEVLVGNFPFWKYFPSPTWKKFENAGDVFTEIAFKYINRSLDKLKYRPGEDTDLTLLQSMLVSEELDASGAMVMVADMLLAGIESTSNTVGFLLYHIAKNPEKQSILFNEINMLLPRKEDRITTEIFNQLHYLKACLKESIRLNPVVRGNVRTLDHDVAINGYRVPAGTAILLMMQVIYRNEKYFKNADKFLPERWLDTNEKLYNPFAFVPFGIGTRSCIGRRLAELEILCLSTEIIRNFALEYHHEDIKIITRAVNIPDRPLRCNFLDR